MNKILNHIKNTLIILNFILVLYVINQNGIGNLYFLVYMIGFFIMILLTIKDIKNQIIPSKQYSILWIIVEILINCLFLRAYLDPNFSCNSSMNQEFIQTTYGIYGDICSSGRFYYFNQNVIYLLLLYFTLYMYHKLEYPQELYKPGKYSKASIILAIINILTVPSILNELYSVKIPIPFLLLEILLLLTEIITLIHYNHKKKDYPIYICFLFNLFAFISIFI